MGMKNRLLWFAFWVQCSCAATSPIVTPPIIKGDTVIITKHDTLISVQHDTLVALLQKDTTSDIIRISPVFGDNYPQLQVAINYMLAVPGTRITLNIGNFPISHPLIFARILNGQYQQVTFDFEGFANAKNTPIQNCSIITPTFTDAPAIIVQLGKGFRIANLAIQGNFHFPDYLNAIQVDTLNFNQWAQQGFADNSTQIYAGVAVDYFSDISNYDSVHYKISPSLAPFYLAGMNRSGSTAGTFEGLNISNFIVGFIVSPSRQQNGEIIHLYHSEIDACKVVYALCQAQSKQCEVKDLEVWRPVHTVFDNVTYGIRQGDGAGSPYVDGVNIANAVHQIFNIGCVAFSGDFANIYGEGVFKIGNVGGSAGALVPNITVDFSCSSGGMPSPDFFINAVNTTFTNPNMRLYPGTVNNERITINGKNNTFIGGNFNLPPVNITINQGPSNNAFFNVGEYYNVWQKTFSDGNYDSLAYQELNNIYIDNIAFTGYIITKKPISAILAGNPVICAMGHEDQFSWLGGTRMIGFVSAVSQDTIYLCNTGWGINSGSYQLLIPTIKAAYQ